DEGEVPPRQACHVEQIVDEPENVLGLTLDDRQLWRLLITEATAEKLGREENRRKGIAELVAKDGQEFILRTVGVPELEGLTPDGLFLQEPGDGTRKELSDLMDEPLVAIVVVAAIGGEADRAQFELHRLQRKTEPTNRTSARQGGPLAEHRGDHFPVHRRERARCDRLEVLAIAGHRPVLAIGRTVDRQRETLKPHAPAHAPASGTDERREGVRLPAFRQVFQEDVDPTDLGVDRHQNSENISSADMPVASAMMLA